MTEHRCDWTEQEIVDCLLGHKSAATQLNLQLHCESCERCNGLFQAWAGILENQRDPAFEPSPRLKVRMGLSMLLQRIKVSFRMRRKMLLSAAAGVLFFALAASLFTSYFRSVESPVHLQNGEQILSLQQEMLENMSFLTEPETHHYMAVSDDFSSIVKGNVWVNKASNEMLIMIEGLQPSERLDYQTWLVKGDQQMNGGLLDWEYGRAHLYVRGQPMNAVEQVSVSLEPKGGSVVPSGPEALNVSLAGKR